MNNINQHFVLNDGRQLGYATYGSKNDFPIIYCHGSQSSRIEMHYDMSFAIENGLRIITVDRPGHGLSDFNPKGSILGFADDIKQLTEHLKIDKFSVAGMSAGSPFALAIAHQFPEQVQKTAIISGFAPFNSESKKLLTMEVKLMLNLAKYFPWLLKMMLSIQDKQLKKKPKKALQGFLKIMSSPDQEILKNDLVMNIIIRMFNEAFRQGSKGVAYEISNLLVKDWKFKLSDIQVPVKFWQGKKDNNVPFEWAELMTKEIKNADIKLFQEEGHLIIFQHAKEIFTELKPNITKQ
ncbi:alpha/beta hydrolase [Aurantibacter sp.]|uniref:alpha/beta fold hydrolase n=1 Tax=Aurantibacter sp. TaxID=2807103 RepID=UPI003264F1A1